MTELKPSWKQIKFGDVVRLSKARSANPEADGIERYVGLEHIDPEDLRIRRWGLVAEGTTFTTCFKPGQVLFGKRRAYQRKVAVADFEGVCSGDIYVFESANPATLLPELLPFICRTEQFFEYAVETSAGSLSPRTNWNNLANFMFTLPPFEEQKQIVQLLRSHHQTCEAYDHALSTAKKMRQAVRKKLFSEGVQGEEQQTSKLGMIPKTWEVRALGEIFDFLDNQRIPIKDSDRQKRPGPYPYYGASGSIDSIDAFIFDEPTLLLAEDGMNLIFRSSPLVYKATGKYWVNNHAHVLKPKPQTDIDFYLEYLEYISYLPYVTGTYQKKITRSDCVAIPVIYPPFDEQKEVTGIFQSLNREESLLRERIISAEKVRKMIAPRIFINNNSTTLH